MYLSYACIKCHGDNYSEVKNKRDSVPNLQRLNGLLNRLFRRSSMKKKPRITGLCEGN